MENKELERIQKELLAEEMPAAQDDAILDEFLNEEMPELLSEEELSLDELLEDEELNQLLREEPEPAFDDPEKIHDPKEPLVYHNFATEQSAQEKSDAELIREKDERVVMALMIVASVLCLGIIGVLGYWMGILL